MGSICPIHKMENYTWQDYLAEKTNLKRAELLFTPEDIAQALFFLSPKDLQVEVKQWREFLASPNKAEVLRELERFPKVFRDEVLKGMPVAAPATSTELAQFQRG